MLLLDELADAKIQRAMRQGDFDDLPGRGAPLVLDDDSFVPEALRAAYRVLKNAGFVPPEIGVRREIRDVEELIAGLAPGTERRRAVRRLNLLLARLSAARGDRMDLVVQDRYCGKLADKLSR